MVHSKKNLRFETRSLVVWAVGAACLLPIGCHTGQGIKQDTKDALDATGKGLRKGAAKIDGPEGGAPSSDTR